MENRVDLFKIGFKFKAYIQQSSRAKKRHELVIESERAYKTSPRSSALSVINNGSFRETIATCSSMPLLRWHDE